MKLLKAQDDAFSLREGRELKVAKHDLNLAETKLSKEKVLERLKGLKKEDGLSELDKLRKELQAELLKQEVMDEHEVNKKIQQIKKQIKTEAALEELIYKMYEDFGLADKPPEDFGDEEKKRENLIYGVLDKIKAK